MDGETVQSEKTHIGGRAAKCIASHSVHCYKGNILHFYNYWCSPQPKATKHSNPLLSFENVRPCENVIKIAEYSYTLIFYKKLAIRNFSTPNKKIKKLLNRDKTNNNEFCLRSLLSCWPTRT